MQQNAINTKITEQPVSPSALLPSPKRPVVQSLRAFIPRDELVGEGEAGHKASLLEPKERLKGPNRVRQWHLFEVLNSSHPQAQKQGCFSRCQTSDASIQFWWTLREPVSTYDTDLPSTFSKASRCIFCTFTTFWGYGWVGKLELQTGY